MCRLVSAPSFLGKSALGTRMSADAAASKADAAKAFKAGDFGAAAWLCALPFFSRGAPCEKKNAC